MGAMNLHGQYWDMQAVSQANIMSRLEPGPARSWATRWLADRLAKLTAGRAWALNYPSIEQKLWEVDPDLRLRWEFDHPDSNDDKHVSMPAIDRYVRELGYYWTICYWSHPFGEGSQIREILRESDMQRPNYHRDKTLTAELTRERWSKVRAEMALEAIDKLSTKQCKEFVAVETAMRNGEKIQLRGKDAEMVQKMYENTKKMDAMGMPGIPGEEYAINPQHNPMRHARFGESYE